ncbi:glycosyltransferase [Oscillatoria sp. FACHB-1406]|nr:glycosyltransferase [Oscillatoria sp. FACHB-1406]
MANEEFAAESFVREVLQQCTGFRSVRLFAVLDRVSRDNTLNILKDLALELPELQVIFAPENRCVVDAYVRGYKEALAAGCDWILEIDAGYSHQPSDIPQFFHIMSQGYDCVFGSRFCKGGRMTGGVKRYLVSYGGTALTNLLLGTKLKDMTSGFELFNCFTLNSILDRGIRSRGHFFQTEIKFYCRNFNLAEVPINYKVDGNSVNSTAIQDALKNLWRLFVLRIRGKA